MVLYPEARLAVEQAVGLPELWDVPIAEGRESDRRLIAEAPRDDVAEVQDLDAEGVPCRLYVPNSRRSSTLLIHLHGGGFVFGGIDTQDPACRRMANLVGMDVLSVGYRLAPENKYPAARDDVDTVIGWVSSLGRESLVAHGDSAGANLALVAALRNPGRLRGLVLVYPFLDPTASFASYEDDDTDFTRERALWFWSQYVESPSDLDDPDVAPLLSPLLGTLPPTLVVTAER